MTTSSEPEATAKTESLFQDTFVREIRINYATTSHAVFKFTGPSDVADFVRSVLPDNSREHCVALYLNGANQVVSYSVVSSGTANHALVHPREVFQRAITTGAVAVVFSHNHPSGETSPSKADKDITKALKEAGELLKIPLLDHVIVTDDSEFSFKEQGRL